MTLYTSDIDTIYSQIKAGTITSDVVRIISSEHPQSLQILKDFPNIEEILCFILCSFDHLLSISDLILERPRLTLVSFTVLIPISDRKAVAPPSKRRRVHSTSCYDKAIKVIIPEIIKNIGRRMRYLTININIIDGDSNKITLIMLNKGFYCVGSKTGSTSFESNRTEKMFQALASTGSLRGIITKGDSNYKINDIGLIPEVTIIARIDAKDNPVNDKYLINLVSKAEIVDISYSPGTIEERYIYSEIIRKGSSGSLKRIKGIVPVCDAEEHIENNKDLEEIHVIVRHNDDIQDMKAILEKYKGRAISYYIHYCYACGSKYWLDLQSLGFGADIVFEDIIRTLM